MVGVKSDRNSIIHGAIYSLRESKKQEKAAVQTRITNLKEKNHDLSKLVLQKKIDLEERKEAHEKQIEETKKELIQKEDVLNKQRLICAVNKVKSVKERSENEEKIGTLVQKSKLLKGALDKTYGLWLAESDWKNIDLLIYYLETGRADHLKESLLLLDQQKQTDQIVNAISAAKTSISQTVQTAMSRLGMALSKSFSVISTQLKEMEKTIRESTREQRRLGNRLTWQNEESLSSYASIARATMEQTARLESKFNEQISEARLNGALLEKANRSSEELLNDLRYGQRYWVK